MKTQQKIDFVVTWVDGSDYAWQKEKAKWEEKISGKKTVDCSAQRYRDMGTLKYWFRAIEKNAQWVNKIFFVTCGQIPEWLNTKHEKIVVVNHSDFIPKQKLPTFNSNAIESYLHLIPGLSENFVYFNDDMFILNKTKDTDFFNKNQPRDCMTLSPLLLSKGDNFHRKVLNDLEVINKHFNFKECYKNNKLKYLSLRQKKYLFRTIPLTNYGIFTGFQYYHLPVSYNKETFRRVWEKEESLLDRTASFKFRNNYDSVNHWLFEYWQFAEGNFSPRRSDFGRSITISDNDIEKVFNRKKYKVICINDSGDVSNFDAARNRIINLFEKKYPEKCSYEK